MKICIASKSSSSVFRLDLRLETRFDIKYDHKLNSRLNNSFGYLKLLPDYICKTISISRKCSWS